MTGLSSSSRAILADALKSHLNSLAIIDRMAKSDPGSAIWQDNLLVSYRDVGDVQVAQGNIRVKPDFALSD
jgi:hypothetical protein